MTAERQVGIYSVRKIKDCGIKVFEASCVRPNPTSPLGTMVLLMSNLAPKSNELV